MIKPLLWTETIPPDDSCRYHHVSAQTPFGRFLITWKEYKTISSHDIEETPWGEGGGSFFDLDSAKLAAEQTFYAKVKECFATTEGGVNYE